jgi:hypothetical protein
VINTVHPITKVKEAMENFLAVFPSSADHTHAKIIYFHSNHFPEDGDHHCPGC